MHPVKERFDFDRHTSAFIIRRRLDEAREMGGIYRIARIIQVLKHRNIQEELRVSEHRRLIEAIGQARHGKELPLKSWLPRGYQIARLLNTAMAVIPGFKPRVTSRDIRLIREALGQFKREKKLWGKEQIPCLIHSAKELGVKLRK